jgi:hypothetical protein
MREDPGKGSAEDLEERLEDGGWIGLEMFEVVHHLVAFFPLGFYWRRPASGFGFGLSIRFCYWGFQVSFLVSVLVLDYGLVDIENSQ